MSTYTLIPIHQSALYKCQTKKKLEKLLTLEEGQLRFIAEAIKYKHFQIDKKNTTEKRQITAPTYTLKSIQKRILQLIQRIERPEWVISGRKGKSYIDNGRFHQNCKYALTIDITKFYENCHREYVFCFFRDKLKTSSDVAEILTDITILDKMIPTGCPTSQLLAYFAYEEMFSEINAVAIKHGCKFSLYVDDMTFSSDIPFDPQKLQRAVELVLRRYGHKLKKGKTRFYSKGVSKHITGAIVTPDNEITVPNSLRRRVYEGFQEIKEGKCEDQIEFAGKLHTLQGRLQASKNLEVGIFSEITRLTKRISDQCGAASTVKSTQKKKSKRKKIVIKKNV